MADIFFVVGELRSCCIYKYMHESFTPGWAQIDLNLPCIVQVKKIRYGFRHTSTSYLLAAPCFTPCFSADWRPVGKWPIASQGFDHCFVHVELACIYDEPHTAFHRFFRFPSSSDEIEIPDVEPVAFMVLLKYLYCDEIDLEPDTVLAVLYAAKKYIVPHLARSCVRFLEISLSAKNACVLLSQSRLFEVQCNPATTDFKGPTNLICYLGWFS